MAEVRSYGNSFEDTGVPAGEMPVEHAHTAAFTCFQIGGTPRLRGKFREFRARSKLQYKIYAIKKENQQRRNAENKIKKTCVFRRAIFNVLNTV